jgi:hypothetical protein
MINATFDAKYAAMLQNFISSEKTRFYLHGFLIEPHPIKGVILAATDGHVMAVIHDENGKTDGTGIVKLKPYMVKACKSNYGSTIMAISGETASLIENGKVMESQSDIFIAGDFPDWRRVVPKNSIEMSSGRLCLSPKLLAKFSGLAGAKGDNGVDIFQCDETPGSPMIIRPCGLPEFFGVLMPLRRAAGKSHPDWLKTSHDPACEKKKNAPERESN